METRRSEPRGFGHVQTWVFDLDNTLYPHHLNLWQQVDERIRAYVFDFLKISKDEAFRLQKDALWNDHARPDGRAWLGAR